MTRTKKTYTTEEVHKIIMDWKEKKDDIIETYYRGFIMILIFSLLVGIVIGLIVGGVHL